VWQVTDRLYNYEIHSETKRKPAEHYESRIGVRGFPDARMEDLIQLLPVSKAKRVPGGVVFRAIPYWCREVEVIPVGATINIHYHPVHWETVLLSVVNSGGEYEFLGVAEYYDVDHPAPGIAERRQLVGSLAELLGGEDLARMEAAASGVRERAIGVAAEEISEALIGAVEEEMQGLESLAAARLITSGPDEMPCDGQDPGDQEVAMVPVEAPEQAIRGRASWTKRSRPASTEVLVNPFD
jgi:hypothetical protein